jgi:glycine/D-amino acid oxidase-like deaminating enzyme
MAITSDVIIIGGGIHGASLAYHLTLHGLKPLVIERRFVAAESTGQSSGIIRMHYDLEVEARLAWHSFQYFKNWEELVGGTCDFVQTGFIRLVSQANVENLRANLDMLQNLGIPTYLITAEDVQELFPSMRADDFEIAAYEPGSGYIDPSAAALSFLSAARHRGADLLQACQVTSVQVEKGRVTGVNTTTGEYSAPVVVNAAGPWAADVGFMVGVELPVAVWRHDAMFIKAPPVLDYPHPVVIDRIKLLYLRPETGGLTLVGLEDGNPVGGSPDGYIQKANAGFVERAIERVCQRVPVMIHGSLHSSHGGYDGITPDQRALLGHTGPDGFYVVCGFSGTGLKIAPAVGLCMAELIADGCVQTIDISPFAPSRFTERKFLVGEYDYGDTL